MNIRGHRGKVDGNHAAIVEALRKSGWQVLSLASIGDGCPDLLIHHQYRGWRLVEVKLTIGKLRPSQELFMSRWPVTIVRSVQEALDL